MELFGLLGTKSRRAFTRLYKPRFCSKRAKLMNRYYMYKPRGDLIERLATITGSSPDVVLDTLKKERIQYLRAYHPEVDFKEWEVI